ncbi:MAG: hypothetical protein ACRD2I_21890 [Vicinamibacterales bacterium]
MTRYAAMLRMLRTAQAVILSISVSAIDASSHSVPELDGPPPPVAPEVVSRDASDQVTVRAIKLTASQTVDGKLDDAVYRRERSFGDPRAALPAQVLRLRNRAFVVKINRLLRF